MTEYALSFAAPTSPDLVDATINYNLGVKFTTSVALPCVGVLWRIPTTVPTGAALKFALWDVGSTTRLAVASYTPVAGDAGTIKRVYFASSVNLTAGTTYLASVSTPNHYVATTNDTWPKTTSPLTAISTNGWLVSAVDPAVASDTYPSTQSANTSNFHVSPILRSPNRRRTAMTVYAREFEGRLNDILTTLGTTQAAIWPCYESTGTAISGIAAGDLTSNVASGTAQNLETSFSPALLPGGIYSYHFLPSNSQHLNGIDNDAFTFGNGTTDNPFSVGAWIRPVDLNANTVIAKYDSAGLHREWRLHIDGTGHLTLETYDESATASWIVTTTSALTANQWQLVTATYDGNETSAGMSIYVNTTLATSAAAVKTGSYVAMENQTAPLTVGCSGVNATPLTLFHGRIALPFVTGKQLTASDVQNLYAYTAPLVGVA